MNRESGQVTIFAALMLIVFVSVAAFCMNAAYAFHQHTQMQAEVDSGTLYASSQSCTASTSTPTGMVFVTPPVSGPYLGNTGYCQGSYQKSPGSLFGKILSFPFHISVQAVALRGGSTEPYFALLGLSTAGDSHGCSIYFQDASMVATIDGNAYSDSSSSYSSCGGNRNITFTSPYTYTSSSSLYDPFETYFPSSGNTTLSHCKSSGSGMVSLSSSTCLSKLDESCLTGLDIPTQADDYYQATSATAEVTSLGNNNSKEVYLPYCSSSTLVPTAYLVDGVSGANNGVTDNSSSNTYIISSTVVLQSNVKITSSGAFTLTSPGSGRFAGYALYEKHNNPCASYNNAQFTGTSLNVVGLFDMACGDVTYSGSGSYSFRGSVVAYTITFAGASAGAAVFVPPPVFPPRGAFLVQ